MNEVLKELVVESGCDSCAWSENDRRNAVVEALQQDEAQKLPDLLTDCLIEAAADAKFRRAVIEALEHQQVGMRLAALGLAVQNKLMGYVLAQCEAKAVEHEGEWLAAHQRESAHAEAERRFDAQREGVA